MHRTHCKEAHHYLIKPISQALSNRLCRYIKDIEYQYVTHNKERGN